ncbi:hypothetical protein NUSPORA_00821 [Nucleospora cyclopteri]
MFCYFLILVLIKLGVCDSFVECYHGTQVVDFKKHSSNIKYTIDYIQKKNDKITLLYVPFIITENAIKVNGLDYTVETDMITLGIPKANRIFMELNDKYGITNHNFNINNFLQDIRINMLVFNESYLNEQDSNTQTGLRYLENREIDKVLPYIQFEFLEVKFRHLIKDCLFFFIIKASNKTLITEICYIDQRNRLVKVDPAIIVEEQGDPINYSDDAESSMVTVLINDDDVTSADNLESVSPVTILVMCGLCVVIAIGGFYVLRLLKTN